MGSAQDAAPTLTFTGCRPSADTHCPYQEPSSKAPLQDALNSSNSDAATPRTPGASSIPAVLDHYQIIRRSGDVLPFAPQKIAIVVTKAFLAVRALLRSRPEGGTFHIEDVQDHVELALMRGGHQDVARAYVLYREARNQERAAAKKKAAEYAAAAATTEPTLHVTDNGQRLPLDQTRLQALISAACHDLNADISPAPIVAETLRNLYDGVPLAEVYKAAILAARTLIERDPDYSYVTARLLLHTIVREVLQRDVQPADMAGAYADDFPRFIQKGVDHELLNPELLQFDLHRLGAALKAERDQQFDYLGLQTLYDRYFLHVRKTRIELPQSFFMRVAMGLALNEDDRNARH